MHRTRITILLALALFVGSGALAVQAFSPLPPVDAPIIVRLYVRDRDHLSVVAGELDIWETHPQDKYVVAAVTPAQYQWLEGLGYRLEIDTDRTGLLEIQAALDPRFYYFDDYQDNSNGLYVVDFLQDINAAFPDLTELIDIGAAWMAAQPGEHDRDIWVLRITNEDPSYGLIENKPVFFLFATIHAREVAVPELAIRYIRYLTEGYDGEGGYDLDPDVTWLVNHNIVYVLVMQNPDGHWKNEQNTNNYHRKNMNSTACGAGNLGIDLNRNHSFLWSCCGGSSGNPCSDTYRGPSRGSEPETQAFESYFATVMRDQNGPNGDDEIPPAAPITTTGIFITLHSYGDLVLWPWGFDNYGDSPNYAQMRTIGRKFAYYNGYDPSATIWYDVDGATDDWTYGKFGIPSYTFEVGSGGSCGGFFPADGCIDGIDGMSRNFWAENKPAFLYAHKIARTPYMTSYGPDAEELAVAPGAVPQSLPVQLTAAIADHRYGGDTLQPIAAAEYFVDAPGDDGAGIPMLPADGDWGDLSETVTAAVDTSGMAPGKHYLLVHGQNDSGDWGPFTAVFVTVLTPTYGVVLTPTTTAQSGAPGTMAIYTLTLENTGNLAETYDIGATATWPTMPSLTSTELVSPGGTVDLTVEVAIPSLAYEGDFDAATVTATSAVVSASSVLTTTAQCVEITDVELTLATIGTVYTDTSVEFEANVAPDNASTPYTYTIDYGAGPSAPIISRADPLTAALDHVFALTGAHTVEVAVWNCDMLEPMTDTVAVVVSEFGVCVALTGITLEGETTGYPGMYTFTTSYQPPNATLPITYTWAFDDDTPPLTGVEMDVVSHTYHAAGLYTVTLKAANACPSSDSQSILVRVMIARIYLPLYLS
jgi:carboxypeptidase T